MKKQVMAIAVLLGLVLGIRSANAQMQNDKPVVRIDPALDVLISPDAKLELVKSGFGFTEGPVWMQKGKNGFLLFSDMPANVIYRWTPEGELSVYLDHSGYTGHDIWNVGMDQTNGKDPSDPQFRRFPMIGSDGLTLDPQGRLVIATWAGRTIDRIEKDGKRVTLASRYDGKRFGGPNDIVVKKDGAIYFTDGFGGLRGRDKDPGRELDPGIYLVKDGKVTLLLKDYVTPNGLAFSPDEKVFYANDTTRKLVMRYDVQPDDTVTNGRLFIDTSTENAPGNPDGMKVDTKGNVYESGPGGIWIVSAEGKRLGTILVPEGVANLGFGDADSKTLYITAHTSIYKIRTNVAGIRP